MPQVLIVGGGPTGMMLAAELRLHGVEVTVLEKHRDFLRDFRGDTVHPSTLTALDDLGLFAAFDALPHSQIQRVAVPAGDGTMATIADFSRLRVPHPYVAMVPQWDLLDLLADAAAREPSFTLLREHDVTGLVREGARVTGVEYRSARHGAGRLAADLVVACDGRWSTVRRAAGLRARSFPVDFDVWWLRVPTTGRVPGSLIPRVGAGHALVAIPREGYLQLAYLTRKGAEARLRGEGIDAFRARIADLIPDHADGLAQLTSLEDVKHLDVRVDRTRRWDAPGVLLLGDAAHAMSPVGGVGINLAIQDAIAAARVLARPLRDGEFRGGWPRSLVRRVQRRRRMPTVLMQSVQRALHARLIDPALRGRGRGIPRPLVRVLERVPALTVLPARLIGLGPRPERIPRWARRAP